MLDNKSNGGEGGIRTPDTGVSPYNGLANRRLQPLGHLSGDFQQFNMPAPGSSAALIQSVRCRHAVPGSRRKRLTHFLDGCRKRIPAASLAQESAMMSELKSFLCMRNESERP